MKNGVLIIQLFLHKNHDFRFPPPKGELFHPNFTFLFLFHYSSSSPEKSSRPPPPRPPSPPLTEESQKSNRGTKLVYTVKMT